MIFDATYLPCCIATGAIPGSVLPFEFLKFAASPITKILSSSLIEQS